ncbi:hypothetical protein ACE6H2_002238 [Prunus campanulata]
MPIPTSPLGLPIPWGQSVGSMTIPTSPRGYQSFGVINWVHVNPYITFGVTNPLGTIKWIYADPNITPRVQPTYQGNELLMKIKNKKA